MVGSYTELFTGSVLIIYRVINMDLATVSISLPLMRVSVSKGSPLMKAVCHAIRTAPAGAPSAIPQEAGSTPPHAAPFRAGSLMQALCDCRELMRRTLMMAGLAQHLIHLAGDGPHAADPVIAGLAGTLSALPEVAQPAPPDAPAALLRHAEGLLSRPAAQPP